MFTLMLTSDLCPQVFERMFANRLFPSMVSYIHVMNALSRHGHGAMVTQVMDKFKNTQWLTSGGCGRVGMAEYTQCYLLLLSVVV